MADDPALPLGSSLAGDVVAGDKIITQTAGGDIVGRDKVVQNIHMHYAEAPAVGARAAPQPAQVFISYKRNAEPDEPFALQLHRVLSERNHQPVMHSYC